MCKPCPDWKSVSDRVLRLRVAIGEDAAFSCSQFPSFNVQVTAFADESFTWEVWFPARRGVNYLLSIVSCELTTNGLLVVFMVAGK